MFEFNKYNNGMELVTSSMPHMQSVAVGIWVRAGGRYEKKEVSGISHFLEHMSFKGTPNRTSKEISQAIEGIGGSMNAFTSEEMTCYYSVVPSTDLKTAFDVLSDIYQNSLLDQVEIDKERGVILDEMRMYQDIPSHYATDLLGELLYPNHPLGRNLVGSEETVNQINQAHFKEYKGMGYSSQNTLISVAGSFNQKEVSEYSLLFSQILNNFMPHDYEKYIDQQSSHQLLVKNKDIAQVHYNIGFKGSSRTDPDRFKVKLLSVILGENMSSRLFQELRENMGLTYDINSCVDRYHDTGIFSISAGVDQTRFYEAFQATLEQLTKIVFDLVDQSELDLARKYIKGQLSMSLEKTSSRMMYIGEQMLCNHEILTQNEINQSLDLVEVHDIQMMAKQLFNKNKINVSIVGPDVVNQEKVDQMISKWSL